MKKFFIVVLAISLCSTNFIFGNANGKNEMIKVYKNTSYNVWVKGNFLKEDTFFYKDRLYVPLVTVGNLTGEQITYDPEIKSIIFGDRIPTPSW